MSIMGVMRKRSFLFIRIVRLKYFIYMLIIVWRKLKVDERKIFDFIVIRLIIFDLDELKLNDLFGINISWFID